MPGLSGAWRAICRTIVRRRTAVAADSDTSRTDRSHRRSNALAIARTVGNRLHAFFRSTRQRVQQTQRNRTLPWLEAMENVDAVRKERRAKRRALLLLMRLLNPEQRQEFRERRYFHVTGGSSRERYRIRMDMIANIDVLGDDGKTKYRLCIHPTGGVPVYDVMAAQLLHLQDPATEERFRHQANVLPALPEDRVYPRSVWLA